jgi:hypothetical protein
MRCADGRPRNTCPLRHSSRSRPIKLSTNAFSVLGFGDRRRCADRGTMVQRDCAVMSGRQESRYGRTGGDCSA